MVVSDLWQEILRERERVSESEAALLSKLSLLWGADARCQSVGWLLSDQQIPVDGCLHLATSLTSMCNPQKHTDDSRESAILV